MHFSSKYKSVKIDQNNWVPHKTWNWSYRLFRKYPNPSLDCPFSVVWDRSRSIMSLTVNIMFWPTTHFYPLWTIYFRWPSTFISTLLIFHFFFISRPFTFNPEDHPIRTFIPYRFHPKDHPLCEFRSTFADRSLLVTLGPVQTPWTIYLRWVAFYVWQAISS